MSDADSDAVPEPDSVGDCDCDALGDCDGEPLVLGEPDALGGRWSVEASAFNVYREAGTRTQRAAGAATYDMPFNDPLGGVWTVSAHATAEAWNATDLNLTPNYSPLASSSLAQGLPQAAMIWRWFTISTARLNGEVLQAYCATPRP